MKREIDSKVNLLTGFILILLAPMVLGYLAVTTIELVLTKINRAL